MAPNMMLALALIALPAVAQVYKSTDEHGTTVYSDTPPADGSGSEEIAIPPTNTAPPPPRIAPAQPPESAVDVAAKSELSVAITAPANETTIPMGGGIFEVTASASAPLGEGQTLQLYLDGEPRGAPQAARNWTLNNVFRGAHDLTVKVLDADGAVLATSPPIRVYVLRPSVN